MHRSKQRPQGLKNSSVSAGPHINTLPVDQSFTDEGLDSGGEYDFTVKNNIYELQSRCNSLEYDKYKRAISYIETTNELQNKTDYLEEMNTQLTQQVQSLSDERDILRTVLGEVREQNYSFSKEINLLKVELNRMINNQGSCVHQDRTQGIQIMKNIIQRKDRQIQLLTQQLKSAHKARLSESPSLQHQRHKAKIQSQLCEANRRQGQLKIEIQELARHYKRKELEQKDKYAHLQNQIKQLLEQIQQKEKNMGSMKHQYLQLSKQLQEKTNRFRVIQGQRTNLQNKLCEVELQAGRLKCQKNNLEQYKNYLETVNQENQSKRKTMQQQIFKLQSENSEIREHIFSEKLQAKKQASKFKLQIQEQKLRHQQTLANHCNKRKSSQIEALSRKVSQQEQQIREKDKIIKSKEAVIAKLNEDISRLRQQKIAAEKNSKSSEDIAKTALANQQITKNQIRRMAEEKENQTDNEINKLKNQIKELQNQNITLKQDYSDSLQQINTLLFKYQILEENFKRNQVIHERHSTTRVQNLEHECERLRICLQREQVQVKRLTQLLSTAKIKTVHSNQQKMIKITQPLWLGQERFSIARLGDNIGAPNIRQRYYQI